MTSESVLASAAAQCVQKVCNEVKIFEICIINKSITNSRIKNYGNSIQLLGLTETIIMEPIMNLNVITDDERVGLIMSDLSKRRAGICEFTSRGHSRVRISVFLFFFWK